MKKNDLINIGAVAMATATLTVAAFLPATLEADGGNPLPPKIEQPKLVVNGAQITLAAAKNAVFKAVDEPAFELTAVNTSNQPVKVEVQVAMSAVAAGGLGSRMPMMSKELWKDRCTLALKPHETKTVSLLTGTKAPTNSLVNVSMWPAHPTETTTNSAIPTVQIAGLPGVYPSAILALSFSTRVQPAQPTVVAVK